MDDYSDAKLLTALVKVRAEGCEAVCVELNISASGRDVHEAEAKLREAIEMYLSTQDLVPFSIIAPMSMEELEEFLGGHTIPIQRNETWH